MPYLSAMYAPPDPAFKPCRGQPQRVITAPTSRARTWQLTEDSQVGDWLRFREAGGTVLAYEAPEDQEPAEDE